MAETPKLTSAAEPVVEKPPHPPEEFKTAEAVIEPAEPLSRAEEPTTESPSMNMPSVSSDRINNGDGNGGGLGLLALAALGFGGRHDDHGCHRHGDECESKLAAGLSLAQVTAGISTAKDSVAETSRAKDFLGLLIGQTKDRVDEGNQNLQRELCSIALQLQEGLCETRDVLGARVDTAKDMLTERLERTKDALHARIERTHDQLGNKLDISILQQVKDAGENRLAIAKLETEVDRQHCRTRELILAEANKTRDLIECKEAKRLEHKLARAQDEVSQLRQDFRLERMFERGPCHRRGRDRDCDDNGPGNSGN